MRNLFSPHRVQATLVFLLTLFIYAQSASFNVGCFNIRIKTTDDTDDKDWSNRKEYVGKTITTYDYDVIGLNEIVAGSQDAEVRALLPGYSFVSWGSGSSTVSNTGRINLIAYKSDKFEVVEEGHFFLGPNPEKSTQSWDTSSLANKRLTVWAKLKLKDTGEIFYYFITHLDHKGDNARNEGTRLNIEKMRTISSHYPAIICGDHNATPTRYPVYDLCKSFMNDSRNVSVTPFPLAKDGTFSMWNPTNIGGSRLDYIWVKGITVNTYNHITDAFGRAITPSDHFAVIANITLDPCILSSHSRYVDVTAAEGGDGSKSLPYNNIQTAIDNTGVGDTIYVASGNYSLKEKSMTDGRKATLKVTHSVNIYGGYDSEFENVIGHSVLSGDLLGNDTLKDGVFTGNEDNVYNIITINKYCAVEMSNFEIVGGNASDTNTIGAGILMNGSRLILNNSIIRDNQSAGNGAGIYAAEQLECNDCQFIRNISAASGGAYFTMYNNVDLWWRYSMTRCLFDSNRAKEGAAGYIKGFSSAYFGYNTFVNNEGSNIGAIALMGNKIEGRAVLVNNTFTANRLIVNDIANIATKGGAVLDATLNDATNLALVNNTIVGNSAVCNIDGATSDFCGAAINIRSGMPYINNNIIAGNTSTSTFGGDIYNTGKTAVSNYNVYSCDDNINITTSATDIKGTSFTDAVASLSAMLEGTVVNGVFVPKLADNGGPLPTIKVIAPTFGTSPINVLAQAQFAEYLLKGDVDNTLELKSYLTIDQRGELRDSNGKSSIGSYEYGVSGVNMIDKDVDEVAFVVTCEGTKLQIEASKNLNGGRIFSVSGACVMNIGTINEGINTYDISNLTSGVYIVSIAGKGARFIK